MRLLSIRALVVFVVLASGASPLLAQLSTARRTAQRPLAAGPVLFYPFWVVDASRTDNLFRNRSGVSATLTTISPGVVAEIPFSASQINLGASVRYRDYEGADIDNRFSLFALSEGRLRFPSGWQVDWDAAYQRGVLDTQLFDPGGEITFSGDEFSSFGTMVSVGHERELRRRLALSVRRDEVDFDRDSGVGFFDSDSIEVQIEGAHRRGRNLWVRWDVRRGQADLFRPLGSGEDRREERDLEIAGGLRWQLSPGSAVGVRLGFKSNDFVSDRDGSFSGIVGSVDLVRNVPGQIRWTLRGARAIYPSIYENNDYYESDQLTTRLDVAPEARLVVGGQLTYGFGRYPEPVPRRRDRLLEARAWVGYRFRGVWEWRINATKIHRSSTIDSLEFDTTSIGMSFGFGG